MLIKKKINHKFPSCSRTYVTFCVYHKSLDPKEITEILKIQPDWARKAGEVIRKGKFAPKSAWLFSTEEKKIVSKSKDMRAHVKWILDKLSPKKKEIRKLIKSGCEMWIYCFWVSSTGNGGPELDHEFIKTLSAYPIDLHFDIYFD